jgi:hypothetical protein
LTERREATWQKLFEVVLRADDGLYHLFLVNGRVLKHGYSTPEGAFKAYDDKMRSSPGAAEDADRAISAGENVVRFPVPTPYDDG